MKTTSVSVIIPTYRDGDALRRALASVADQSLRPRQVIVVDDATGDDSADKICAEARIPNIKLLKLPRNTGPGAARNAGIASSTEAFLAFLDADDEWHPEKLERQMVIMYGPGAPLLSAHRKGFDGLPWPNPDGPLEARSITRWAILASNVASISTVVIQREAVKYLFRPSYACEDYWFVAANILSGVKAVRIKQMLARAHKPAFGADGLSGQLHAMLLGEMSCHFSLWREELMNVFEYVFLIVWTLVKFLRRIAVVELRKIGALVVQLKGENKT
ncbi:glycosyltransferase family 2 protein [Bradyrhizobium sp. UFLA05-112]